MRVHKIGGLRLPRCVGVGLDRRGRGVWSVDNSGDRNYVFCCVDLLASGPRGNYEQRAEGEGKNNNNDTCKPCVGRGRGDIVRDRLRKHCTKAKPKKQCS